MLERGVAAERYAVLVVLAEGVRGRRADAPLTLDVAEDVLARELYPPPLELVLVVVAADLLPETDASEYGMSKSGVALDPRCSAGLFARMASDSARIASLSSPPAPAPDTLPALEVVGRGVLAVDRDMDRPGVGMPLTLRDPPGVGMPLYRGVVRPLGVVGTADIVRRGPLTLKLVEHSEFEQSNSNSATAFPSHGPLHKQQSF